MNYIKLITDKCHLLTSRNKNEEMWAKLDRDIVWKSNDVKILRITSDNNLKFAEHLSNICSKANRKITALTRLAKFLPFKKSRILFKAFIESQFKCCPLAWMFHGRKINDKLKKLHERALRIVYNDTIMSFEELLDKDKTFTIHHQYIKSLPIEIYKAMNNLPGGNFYNYTITITITIFVLDHN